MNLPRLIVPSNTRHYIAVFLVFLLTVRSTATTVLVAITAEGIVVASDRKHVVHDESWSVTSRQADKVFVVKNRFAVGCLDSCRMSFAVLKNKREVPVNYDFETWVAEANKHLPTDTSFDAVVNFLKDKLTVLVNEDGDGPAVHPEVFEPNPPTDLYHVQMQLVIAGYEKRAPRMEVVESYLDWQNKRLIGPYTIVAPPFPIPAATPLTAVLFPNRLYPFGIFASITDVWNPKSYVYQQATDTCPVEFKKFYADEPVTLKETEALLSELVGIEEQTNPETVGGDIRLVEISQSSGIARVVSSEPCWPKNEPKEQTTEQ